MASIPRDSTIPAPSIATRMCGEADVVSAWSASRSLIFSTSKNGERTNTSGPSPVRGTTLPALVCNLIAASPSVMCSSRRTPVIVQAIRNVGRLLGFYQNHAATYRVHRSRVNVQHVAGLHVYPVQQLFRAGLVDGALELSRVTPAFSPRATCASGAACNAYQHSVFPKG